MALLLEIFAARALGRVAGIERERDVGMSADVGRTFNVLPLAGACGDEILGVSDVSIGLQGELVLKDGAGDLVAIYAPRKWVSAVAMVSEHDAGEDEDGAAGG